MSREQREIFSAGDVANYVVCPEAWRLKYFGIARKKHSSREVTGQRLRDEWIEQQDLSTRLRYYTKIAYALLVVLVLVVFILDRRLVYKGRRLPLNTPQAVSNGHSP